MSTIQTQAVGLSGKLHRQEAKSAPPPVSEKPQRASDQEMMYAWSIGVTSLGKAHLQPQRQDEDCPPEVYIG